MPIDVLAKITHGYYQLTTAEKKVADYVLLHTWETQYMSISELAEACDVAEATVSRFCRRLRFSGYSGFKLALANTPQSSTPRLTGDIAPDDSVEELLEKLRTAHIDALDQTMRLLAPGALDSLPDAENVIYMAGKKFGTDGNEYATWAMNTWLPSRVAERYQNSRIVVFSSGNLYPKVGVHSGGATEETRTEPVGEYCMSCQGRERMFEYAAKTYGTRVAVYRLNYAVDLRYGVLYDMAHNILEGKPISITTPSFNCIWQGDANEAALRLLGHASAEVFTLNVTGPETAGVQETAKKLGALLGREPIFTGEASDTAYLNNAGKMFRLFGYPTVPLETLIEWQAQWILDGGRALGKPTHFEERKGSY